LALPLGPSSWRRHSGVVRLFNLWVRFQHCGLILSADVAPDAN